MIAHIPNHDSRGLQRIITALKRYAPPSVTFVDDIKLADMVVFLANGRREHLERKIHALTRRQQYAIVQVSIKSTMSPSAHQWIDLWRGANLVWSYYDLQQQCHDEQSGMIPRFYHAPLGVDQNIFTTHPPMAATRYLVATTGLGWLTEGIREATLACRAVDRQSFHIGATSQLPLGPNGIQLFNIPDAVLARYYNSTDYVCGLRRIEGFELPAAEGLLCGARPLLYRRCHYTQWFRQWATYIHERPREEVLQKLTDLFRLPVEPLSSKDIADAKKLFDWQTIIPEFWTRCLNPLSTLGPKYVC